MSFYPISECQAVTQLDLKLRLSHDGQGSALHKPDLSGDKDVSGCHTWHFHARLRVAARQSSSVPKVQGSRVIRMCRCRLGWDPGEGV